MIDTVFQKSNFSFKFYFFVDQLAVISAMGLFKKTDDLVSLPSSEMNFSVVKIEGAVNIESHTTPGLPDLLQDLLL